MFDSIAKYALCSFLLAGGIGFAQQNLIEETLAPEDVRIQDGMIEFRLVNISDSLITAWRFDINFVTDGVEAPSTVQEDYAISSSRSQSEDGRHVSGALMPGDYRFFILGLPAPNARFISISPTLAVFEDKTFVGSDSLAEHVFEERLKTSLQLRYWVRQMRRLQRVSRGSEGEGLATVKEFCRSLRDDFGLSTEKHVFANRFESFGETVLRNMETVIKTVESSGSDVDATLTAMVGVYEEQLRRALYSVPTKQERRLVQRK